MAADQYIVILKSGRQFRIDPVAVVHLYNRMQEKHGVKPWQTFLEGDQVAYMFDLQDVGAIVKESDLIT